MKQFFFKFEKKKKKFGKKKLKEKRLWVVLI